MTTPSLTGRAALLLLVATGCPARAPSPTAPPASAAPAPAAPSPAAPASPVAPTLPPEVDPKSLAALLAAHRGEVVVLNVFASWCAPCRRELPEFGKLKAAHPKLFLVGIDVDEDPTKIPAILPEVPAGMTVLRRASGIKALLPTLRLPSDWNESVPKGWDETVPITLVLDGKGELATGSVGELSPAAVSAIGEIAAQPAK